MLHNRHFALHLIFYLNFIQEYENKLITIKEQYEKEQSSNIKLQQDIEQLKTQYEQHLKQEGYNFFNENDNILIN